MTIQEQIKADLTLAMKSKNAEEVLILRVVMAEFLRVKDLPNDKSVTDEQAIKILRKTSQDCKDTNCLNQAIILEKYLPKELSEQELGNLITEIIQSGANNIGAIMKGLKSSGKIYNGKLANEIIKELL